MQQRDYRDSDSESRMQDAAQNLGGFFKTRAGRFLKWGLPTGFLALIVGGNSVYFVPPTDMAGARIMDKVVSTQPIGPGPHLKLPFIEKIDKTQVSQEYAETQTTVHTVDNQPVDMKIRVIYQKPPSAVLHLLYGVGGAGDKDITSSIESMVSDRAQKVFAGQNTINISRDRSRISDEIRAIVAPDLKRFYGLDVKDVQIPSIGYSPSFNNSINEAMNAKNASIAAQNRVQQKDFEGQQLKVTADAQAYATRATADAQAYAKEKTADADSYTIQKGISAFKGNVVAYNQNQAVHTWHGDVPTTMLSGAMPFLSLPGSARGPAPRQ